LQVFAGANEYTARPLYVPDRVTRGDLPERSLKRPINSLRWRRGFRDRARAFSADLAESKSADVFRTKLDSLVELISEYQTRFFAGIFRLNSGYSAGNWRKMGSEQGSRRSKKSRSSALFVSVVPAISLLGFVPKLDVAGSTPVARSTLSPSRINYL
jgi:hypothetical protein